MGCHYRFKWFSWSLSDAVPDNALSPSNSLSVISCSVAVVQPSAAMTSQVIVLSSAFLHPSNSGSVAVSVGASQAACLFFGSHLVPTALLDVPATNDVNLAWQLAIATRRRDAASWNIAAAINRLYRVKDKNDAPHSARKNLRDHSSCRLRPCWIYCLNGSRPLHSCYLPMMLMTRRLDSSSFPVFYFTASRKSFFSHYFQ